MSSVGVLLLAAGQSTRFGSDKRFAKLENGKTVFETTLAAIVESSLPTLVCLAPKDQRGARLCERFQVKYLVCNNAHLGMGSTLAEGVSGLPNWYGVLIALADMPWIEVSTYNRLADAVSIDNICRPISNGRSGHPVGFGSKYFEELSELTGETGARSIVRKHGGFVIDVDCSDSAISRDVDFPCDTKVF